MDPNYSIDEILSAVDDLQKKRIIKKKNNLKDKLIHKDYSSVPKNTLNLIEEAEKFKK